MSHNKGFCTVFMCIDGRIQALVHRWCKVELNADFPDTVTIAGCDKVLCEGGQECERATRFANISITHHGSRDAVVVGHADCAGNPVSDADHCEHIQRAAHSLANTKLYNRVYGLFVDPKDGRVVEVCRFAAVHSLTLPQLVS